jgi:putative addiction module CopG family antidote
MPTDSVRQFFSQDGVVPILSGMTTVTLTPEQERFAAEAVAQGRYRDVGDVVQASFDLLRRAEAERAKLLTSVLAAQEEGDREGYVTGDEVIARVEARLTRERTAQA